MPRNEDEKIPIAPIRIIDRVEGQMYMFKDEKRIWNGKLWHCEHKKRPTRCVECEGGSICKHQKLRYQCVKCGGLGICKHKIQRAQCIECGGSSICVHEKPRYYCKECEGSGICEHQKSRYYCAECGGLGICEHERIRSSCVECEGSSICIHKKTRTYCVECEGSGVCEHKMNRNCCNSCDPPIHPENWCIDCKAISVTRSNYYPRCLECHYRLYPSNNIPKRARIKEHYLRDRIKLVSELKNVELVFDRRVNGGCSTRRPDNRIELFTHTVIIECDEYEHRNKQCEEKRSMELLQDLGNRPLVIIRFNPDSYTRNNEKIQGCFTPSENGLVLDEDEWEKRMTELVPMIKKYVSEVPLKEFTEKFLFYSDK